MYPLFAYLRQPRTAALETSSAPYITSQQIRYLLLIQLQAAHTLLNRTTTALHDLADACSIGALNGNRRTVSSLVNLQQLRIYDNHPYHEA